MLQLTALSIDLEPQEKKEKEIYNKVINKLSLLLHLAFIDTFYGQRVIGRIFFHKDKSTITNQKAGSLI
jgi:hypothetical protein